MLAFDQPDQAIKANLTPEAAANAWLQYFEPLHKMGVRLGAPNLVYSATSTQWLSSFFQSCNGCHIDFLPFQWYGDSFDLLSQQLLNMYTVFDLPIWLTVGPIDRFI